MNVFRPLCTLFVLPLVVLAAERPLKVDKAKSFVDVDVSVTVGSFTGHLDDYDARVNVDDAGKIKSAIFSFKFSDLKTGKPERDTEMVKWLGGGEPTGRFELGNLALTPDGQGQVSGRLTFHGVTERVEFPINITRTDGVYTIVGETMVDYRTWNLKPIRKALVVTVGPAVKVRFKLTGAPAEPAR